MRVNIHEAKTHLSSLLSRVAEGEEITICNAGRPVATLTAVTGRSQRRTAGGWEGMVIHDDFDAPLPDDVATAFGAGTG